MSPRPKGSKNKTVEERQMEHAAKINAKKSKQPVEAITNTSPVMPEQLAPPEQIDPLTQTLAAIGQQLQNINQRLGALETGQAPPLPYMPISDGAPTMPDYSPMPQASNHLSPQVEAEADAFITANGLNNVKPVNTINLGRNPVEPIRGIRCAKCGRPPMTMTRDGGIIERGVYPHELRKDGTWVHENCIGE